MTLARSTRSPSATYPLHLSAITGRAITQRVFFFSYLSGAADVGRYRLEGVHGDYPVALNPRQFHQEFEIPGAVLDTRECPHVHRLRHHTLLHLPGAVVVRGPRAGRINREFPALLRHRPLRPRVYRRGE